MITLQQRIFKRLMDVFISLIILVLSLPFFFIIYVLILINSHGPAIFRQQRLGKNGKPFKIFKFRTMYSGSPDLRNPDGSTYNAPDDPRLTKLGRHLRKWSLDELPEFLNVLKGEMALVGPRPDQLDQINYYEIEEKERLSVKPGITGWAQIHGRNIIPWSNRKQLDLEYIKNYSLMLDVIILIKTIFYVFKRKDIYISQETDISS